MLTDIISLELFQNTEDWRQNGQLVLHEKFFMLRDFSLERKEFLQSTQPYRLQEGRVVIVKKGWADYAMNLVEHHFTEGDMVVFLAETLIEKRVSSKDFTIDAFAFDMHAPSLPSMNTDLFIMHLNEQMKPVVTKHVELIWDIVQEESFQYNNVALLLNSLLTYVKNHEPLEQPQQTPTHSEDTLRRFMALVSQYAARERNIPFYADKMCLAPHYLSTLIRKISGKTVMQWINQTAVKEIKVWLAYSDETAAQIAYRLNFPCPASLSKFFKRETGMTPGEYRLMHR
jgi:AraC-like DNA-binding protein